MISSAIWNLRSVPVVEFFFRPYNKQLARKIACFEQHEKIVNESIKANLALYEYLLKTTRAEDVEWMSETLKPIKASLIADGVDLSDIFYEATKKEEATKIKGDENMDTVIKGLAATGTAGTLLYVAEASGLKDAIMDKTKEKLKEATDTVFPTGKSTTHNTQRVADNDAMLARTSRAKLVQVADDSNVPVPERFRESSPDYPKRWVIGGYSKETREKMQEKAVERFMDTETVTIKLKEKASEQLWETEKQIADAEAEIEAAKSAAARV